jgi:hypothetical protein
VVVTQKQNPYLIVAVQIVVVVYTYPVVVVAAVFQQMLQDLLQSQVVLV